MRFDEMQAPSIVARIAIGKAIGLVFGLLACLVSPLLVPDVSLMFRIGMLLWYPTMGAFIGVFGVMNYHPVLELPMPWWIRAPLVGAWMNLVLVFFTYDAAAGYLMSALNVSASPFWFVLEGAFVGGLIGYLATRYGGEGVQTLQAGH